MSKKRKKCTEGVRLPILRVSMAAGVDYFIAIDDDELDDPNYLHERENNWRKREREAQPCALE